MLNTTRYETILYNSLCMNNYSNIDISQSSFNTYLNLYIRNFKYQYLKLVSKPILECET